MTTGGGGAVITNSLKLSNKIKKLATICRKNTIEYDYSDLDIIIKCQVQKKDRFSPIK